MVKNYRIIQTSNSYWNKRKMRKDFYNKIMKNYNMNYLN